MESETISTLSTVADILSKGGNAALLFGLWIAHRASETAKKAVADLSAIRASVEKTAPLMEDMAESVKHIDTRTVSLDARLNVVELLRQQRAERPG